MAGSSQACAGLVMMFVVGWALQEGMVDALGINWGTFSINPLPPGYVVKMLQDNNINKVKLFDADFKVLRSMASTNIEVMVAAPNDMLYALANNPSAASDWVRENVTQYLFKNGVNIKYVAVGNEPFLTAYEGIYQNTTFPALQNIQTALVQAGHADTVKATVPFNADVLSSASLPSQVTFRSDIATLMTEIVDFLNNTGAPFSCNLYPFLSLYQNPGFPLDYAFFDGTANPVVDGVHTYQNVFDASYDALVSALTSVGFPNMPIVIGEIGWPTDGANYATIQYAQKFNQELVNHMLGGKGTPLRPGVQIEGYLFGLLDEDAKSILPGPFERHWGIFSYDGVAKYELDLTGGANGGNTSLVNAKYVPYLPAQYCVMNPNGDLSQLAANVAYACAHADCTPLNSGSSCGFLTEEGNASYAFNDYYQFNNQNPAACNFQGLAQVTTQNPSSGTCRFIVGIQPTSGASRRQVLRILAIYAAVVLFSMLLLL